MILTFHGGHFLKIQQGDLVIAANPFSKKSSFAPLRFGARVGLVSADHPDMNGVENLSYGEKRAFAITGPGEYEIGGVSISGFLSPKPFGKEGLLNTIYTIELEGIRLCLLGALATPELPGEIVEGIGEVDILFVPISGGDVLNAADADKIAVTLDAKIVIPVGWSEKNTKELKAFLKESGAESTPPVEKLTLKKKDLEGKEGEVAVLSALDHA